MIDYIVIDIDNTILCTMSNVDKFIEIKYSLPLSIVKDLSYIFTTDKELHCGFFRPNLKNFFEFIKNNVRKIIFWSAGEKSYVDKIISLLIKRYEISPSFIFSRDFCIIDGDMNFQKPIDKLRQYHIDIKNSKIIFIDDNPSYMKNNNRGEIILAGKFKIDDISDIYNDAGIYSIIVQLKCFIELGSMPSGYPASLQPEFL